MRHNLAFGALIIMAVTPIATFLTLHRAGLPSGFPFPTSMAGQGGTSFTAAMSATVTLASPGIEWLVAAWMLGIVVMTMRTMGGLWLAESLRRHDTAPLSSDHLQRCHALQRQLAVSRRISFLQSQRITAPVVIGWLSPVVLLPLAVVTGMPPQQL